MQNNFPKNCKVVVIGGGVAGCSVAYHLAKFGWKDTVLLERDQLTSGTTWHAAGLVGQLGATATITKLRKYSLNLYKELEKKNRTFDRSKTKWSYNSCKLKRKTSRIIKASDVSTIV
jgi:4-methylaminobutanoate oxidase (formaldehyde-forming)